MFENKKKLTKKEIRQDKLVELYFKTMSFIAHYQKQLLIAIGVIAVLVFSYIYFSSESKEKNAEAANLISKVYSLYEQGLYKEAIYGLGEVKGLLEIVHKYDNYEQGEKAKILLANCYNNLGNLDSAYIFYKKYSGSIDLYKSVSLAGQASVLEAKKEYKEAAKLYLKASKITKENPFNSDYLLYSAANYLRIGDKEKAKELLKEIKNNFPTSSASKEADIYLAIAY